MINKFMLLLLAITFVIGPWLYGTPYSSWFMSDTQLGYWWFQQHNFERAAKTYRDPFLKGIALYRNGDFKQAAAAFASLNTPQSHYNRGNALLMAGDYDNAISSYQTALSLRPNWQPAEENLNIAVARKALIKREGGEGTDGKLGADEIRFENAKANPSEDAKQTEQVDGGQLSEAEQQAMWLRKVQTQPADYLRIKFQYQASTQTEPGAAP